MLMFTKLQCDTVASWGLFLFAHVKAIHYTIRRNSDFMFLLLLAHIDYLGNYLSNICFSSGRKISNVQCQTQIAEVLEKQPFHLKRGVAGEVITHHKHNFKW